MFLLWPPCCLFFSEGKEISRLVLQKGSNFQSPPLSRTWKIVPSPQKKPGLCSYWLWVGVSIPGLQAPVWGLLRWACALICIKLAEERSLKPMCRKHNWKLFPQPIEFRIISERISKLNQGTLTMGSGVINWRLRWYSHGPVEKLMPRKWMYIYLTYFPLSFSFIHLYFLLFFLEIHFNNRSTIWVCGYFKCRNTDLGLW